VEILSVAAERILQKTEVELRLDQYAISLSLNAGYYSSAWTYPWYLNSHKSPMKGRTTTASLHPTYMPERQGADKIVGWCSSQETFFFVLLRRNQHRVEKCKHQLMSQLTAAEAFCRWLLATGTCDTNPLCSKTTSIERTPL